MMKSWVAAVGVALTAWGQSTNTGTLAGLVTDTSGALLRGAVLTATSLSTGVPYATSTNAAGLYEIRLPAGIYRVEARLDKFRSEIFRSVEIQVDSPYRMDI